MFCICTPRYGLVFWHLISLSPIHCSLTVSIIPSEHQILDNCGRYSPELGDVVVGRVVEVQTRRWAIEMGAQTHTALQLSAVQLPGGAQRRRTADDELNMRQLFQEGDIIVAEVRPCFPTTSTQIATIDHQGHGSVILLPGELCQDAAV